MPHRLLTRLVHALVLAALLGVVAGSGWVQAQAQEEEGTPAGTLAEGADGAGRTVLLQATLGGLPESPVVVRLSRVSLDPGASLPPSSPPGIAFGVVEEGAATVTVGGAAVLLPAAGDRAEGVEAPVDTDLVLDPGDRIAFPEGTRRGFRNAGSSPLSLLIAAILPAAEAPSDTSGTLAAGEAGVAIRILGEGMADELPPGRAAVTIERFSLVAGDGVPAYPGPVLVAVEVGGFATTLDAGDAQLSEGGRPGVRPDLASNTPFAVRPGDALFFPHGVAATPPLEGDGSLVLLRFGILAVEAAVETPAAAGGVPFAVGSTVVVTVPDVRLRAAPSTSGTVLAGLDQGQVLVITGPPEDGSGRRWYPVEDPTNAALVGFVAAEFLEAQG